MSARDGDGEPRGLVRHEEELRVGAERVEAGRVTARKTVETDHVEEDVARQIERFERVDRVPVDDAAGDSGEIETLPDGSISIPVLEEQLVITKRLVVRERVIVRKIVEVEHHVVEADLRRERVTVEADDDLLVEDDDGESTST